MNWFKQSNALKLKPVNPTLYMCSVRFRKKENILLSPMTKAPTQTEKSKQQHDNTKTPPKTSISQRLRTDLGRSVRLTIATQLVWLNRFYGIPTLQFTTTVV